MYSQSDAGHFVGRGKLKTRYDERNVNIQCRPCNRFGEGRKVEYALALEKKYGPGTAAELMALAQLPVKYDDLWYRETVKMYRAKIKEML